LSKYNTLIYAEGYYGQQSRLSFSVQPFTAVTIDYDKVQLTWASLNSTFNAVRLVRNQVTFPETQEDGVILWEETNLTGTFSRSVFVDGYDNLLDNDEHNDSPLIGGRFAYYRMWLRKNDNVWYQAGDALTIIPKDHGATAFSGTAEQTTHDKVMDLLPKVFTSATQSPLDNVDPTSTLYRFLKGFSLTLDELLTFADVLKPNYSGLKTPPQIVSLQAQQLGLPLEYALGLRAMKRLVREAVYLYNNKGTKLGVQTLAESLTGFAPTVTPTYNLMLSMQDSTFYKGIGNWLPKGNCTISYVNNEPAAVGGGALDDLTHLGGPYMADKTYVGKVVVSTANASIINGSNSPKTRGIPVVPSNDYHFSAYVKSAASSAGAKLLVHWYDYNGALISSATSSTLSVTSTWTRLAFTYQTAPTNAAYLTVDMQFTATGTYFVDMVQVANANVVALGNPTYQEARGVNVFLAPSKTNYLVNPSFDELNTYWNLGDASHTLVDSDFADATDQSKMLRSVTNTGDTTTYGMATQTIIPVGQFYTFSIYAKTDSGTQNFQIILTASDGGLNSIVEQGPTETITTDWKRFHYTIYVPETFSTEALINCQFQGETDGGVVYLDSAQLETSYLPTDYFDGAFPAAYGALWAGTPNQSISYLYPNKSIKVPRLIANLADYMPIGTPFMVETYAGIEYVGIS
jgi:phage tail-like protein